jgi:hypothetical protein
MKHLKSLLAAEFTKRRMTSVNVNERQVVHNLEGERCRLFEGTAQHLPEEAEVQRWCEDMHDTR